MHLLDAALLLALGIAPAAAQAPEGAGPSCTSTAQAVMETLDASRPEYDPLVSNMAEAYSLGRFQNPSDPCELPVVTGESAEPFSEWATAFNSWRQDHIEDYQSIWSACSADPRAFQILPIGPEACSSLAAQITGDGDGDLPGFIGGDNGDGDGDGDGGDGDDGGSEGGSGGDGDNAGTRDTASVVVVAAALAGFLAAGIAL